MGLELEIPPGPRLHKPPLLDVRGLVASPGSAFRIGPLDLTLHQGECVVLFGPSGCGKSSLLRTVGGFLAVDGGEIRLGERSLAGVPPHARDTPMVFQEPLLMPHLDVRGNVEFGLRARGIPARERAARAEEMLARVGLRGFGSRRTTTLSGGQSQRVALARALVVRPQLLLLDEPFSGLDAPLRDDMRLLLRRLGREEGLSLLMVSHDPEDARALADRVAVMEGGRILQFAPAEELDAHPSCASVVRLFSRRNLVPLDSGGYWVLPCHGAVLEALSPVESLAGSIEEGSAAEVLMAPRGKRLRLRATVTDVVRWSDRVDVLLEADGSGGTGPCPLRLTFPLTGASGVKASDCVTVSWDVSVAHGPLFEAVDNGGVADPDKIIRP